MSVSERAHLLLQLVGWSYAATKSFEQKRMEKLQQHMLGSKEYLDALKDLNGFVEPKDMTSSGWDGTCDPAGDPEPENPDKLDEVIAGYKLVGTYNNIGDSVIEANVFRKGGQYFIVFDGSTFDSLQDVIDDWLYADLTGLAATDTPVFTSCLNAAYKCYRSILDKLGIEKNNVTLLGHSLGGGIASALSAEVFEKRLQLLLRQKQSLCHRIAKCHHQEGKSFRKLDARQFVAHSVEHSVESALVSSDSVLQRQHRVAGEYHRHIGRHRVL